MGLEVLTFVKSSWLKPLWKQLGRITGERKEELNRLRDEFVDPELLRDLYIEPFLQDRNPADAHQDDIISASKQPAFEQINEFFRGHLPLEKDGRHQMFILSDAGMGKTSLLLMIKLMHLTDFWPKRYNCVLFKLGEDTLERVKTLEDKGNTVLLLDALDEDPQAWKRIKDRLLDLLEASEDFRRVIISSRTQFFPEMEPDRLGRPEIKVLAGYHCPVLYLSPFTDEQVHDFIERKLPLRWYHFSFQYGRIKKEREKAACLLKHMQDLRMRPMLLQYIDEFLDAGCEREWNAYTVYRVLISKWLDREVRNMRIIHKEKRVPSATKLFWACMRVAEAMARQRKRVISEKDLQQLIREDKNIAWLEKFELGGRSLLNRNSDRAFRFSHYTVQEYLLALGIIHGVLVGQEPLRATDQLVHFLVLANYLYWIGGQLDCSGFNWQGYIDAYDPPSFRDRFSNDATGPKMVLLPGGRFRMGDRQGEGSISERPVHGVELESFALGRYPVTFAEYDAFCEVTGRGKPDDRGWGRGQRPVVKISWEDAVAYCQWLSRETGQTYRLPTEAEWEYACRAGAETAWCFGDDEKLLGEYAWYDKNSGSKTHPVGEKRANAWGLHDMHGNVVEWCLDGYNDQYYGECQRQGVMKNPQGPSFIVKRVMRGGSWLSEAHYCRSASRHQDKPDEYDGFIGFRCARDLGE